MALIRTTFFFKQEDYGWTESYWKNASAVNEPALTTASLVLAQKRVKLSGKETFLKYVRHSAEGVFRDAYFMVVPSDGFQGNSQKVSDKESTALLCTQRTAAFNKFRNLYLRGIWDDVVTLGGLYKPEADWITAFDDYRTRLIADGWGWLAVDQVNKKSVDINAVVANINGTVNVQTVADVLPGPFPQKASVRISGVQGATTLNGVQIVKAAVNGSEFDTRRRIPIFPWTTGGVVTYSPTVFEAIGDVKIQRVVRRKAGRPSYVSRGRQSARAAS